MACPHGVQPTTSPGAPSSRSTHTSVILYHIVLSWRSTLEDGKCIPSCKPDYVVLAWGCRRPRRGRLAVVGTRTQVTLHAHGTVREAVAVGR
eukprot:scaffold673_cov410-Prasinococcus_capsulatus_cf.AAC.6